MTPELQEIRDVVKIVCDRFDDAYWRDKDEKHPFPEEFRDAMAEGGWLGITMPTEFGDAGLGVSEADAGLDASNIKTNAVRVGDRDLVNVSKIWTSTAQVTNKIIILARTTPAAT